MMNQGPSREEFERLYTSMDAGFKGIHDRLDTLNGRTGKGEVSDAEIRQRVTSLEKEVFTMPRRRASDSDGRISKREGALLGLGLGILALILKLCLLLGDVAVEAAKAVIKVK